VYDTETTGLLDFNKPLSDKCQPDIIQLCMKMSLDGKIVSSVNVFVDGDREIEEKAFETHRIDRNMTAACGISRRQMVTLFNNMASKADVLVGHNEEFDQKMMLCAMQREGGSGEVLRKTAHFCTMKSSTNLCKIPSEKKPGTFKWPSLMEAYKTLVNPLGFSNAHDAEADVDACHEVYRVLRASTT
jgi:DNA polymerase III epsilon subunit-like protein